MSSSDSKIFSTNSVAADHKHKIQDSDSLSQFSVRSEIKEIMVATNFNLLSKYKTQCVNKIQKTVSKRTCILIHEKIFNK